jgi:hypothetical protein
LASPDNPRTARWLPALLISLALLAVAGAVLWTGWPPRRAETAAPQKPVPPAAQEPLPTPAPAPAPEPRPAEDPAPPAEAPAPPPEPKPETGLLQRFPPDKRNWLVPDQLPPGNMPMPWDRVAVKRADDALFRSGEPAIFASFVPAALVDRTHAPGELELRYAGGFAAGVTLWGQGITGVISANYLPLEDNSTNEHVDAFWIDAGVGGFERLGSGHSRIAPFARFHGGPSLMLLDYADENSRDLFAAGGYASCGVGLMDGSNSRWGVEIFGDVHGWVGADAHQIQAAYALRAGASLVIRF